MDNRCKFFIKGEKVYNGVKNNYFVDDMPCLKPYAYTERVIRSVSQWSAGTSQPEESIHTAYCSLIEEAKHFIYIEISPKMPYLAPSTTCHFSPPTPTSNPSTSPPTSLNAISYNNQRHRRRRRTRKKIEGECKLSLVFSVSIQTPTVAVRVGVGIDRDRGVGHCGFEMTLTGHLMILLSESNLTYSLCGVSRYVLLSVLFRNYLSLFDIILNYVLEALYMRILQAYKDQKDFRVIIVMPLLCGFQYRTISREKHYILRNLESILSLKTHDYISFYGLRSHGRLYENGPVATSQIGKISDPVADTNTTYKDLWRILGYTMRSLLAFPTIRYTQVDFSPFSSSIAALRPSMVHWKEKLGHTTIDMGIAPDELVCHENGEIKTIDPIHRLKSVKHLVSFPLEFMREEDLRPAVIESEFFVAPQVYH
ncbi:Phospholipase D zeta 1 [Glycine soja]